MGFQSLGRTRSDKPHGTDESDGHSSVEGLPGDDADSECADICELPDADDIVWLCESLEEECMRINNRNIVVGATGQT